MTTKDYVYLGLLALAVLVFYCHGFYAGVNRSRRVYEALLSDEEQDVAPADTRVQVEENYLSQPTAARYQTLFIPPRELRGDFGNN